MVTPEERITRLEAVQEANTQQLAQVVSRLDQALNLIEVARQEARDMNEASRQEARDMNEASRQEAREDNRALRQEMLQLVEATRRESRTFFLALIAIGAAIMGTVIGTSLAG